MSVALIDTSVFCELLGIPGKSNASAAFRAKLKTKTEAHEILLLPMTTIIETGNFIGQCSPDGGKRRHHATVFCEWVRKAIDGEAPFIATPFPDPTDLRAWLAEFADWAMRTDERGKGSGLGDLTIKKEWDRQCALNPSRRVYVWSQDQQLGMDVRGPLI